MQRYTFKRIVIWTICKGAFVLLVWFGCVQAYSGPYNIVALLTVLLTIGSFGSGSAAAQAALRESGGRRVPRNLSIAGDMLVVSLMVWAGSWFLGLAYLWSAIAADMDIEKAMTPREGAA